MKSLNACQCAAAVFQLLCSALVVVVEGLDVDFEPGRLEVVDLSRVGLSVSRSRDMLKEPLLRDNLLIAVGLCLCCLHLQFQIKRVPKTQVGELDNVEWVVLFAMRCRACTRSCCHTIRQLLPYIYSQPCSSAHCTTTRTSLATWSDRAI